MSVWGCFRTHIILVLLSRVSQKIKSVDCLSVDLSIFLANLSTDLAGAKICFFVFFCVPENILNLSACLLIFTFGGSTLYIHIVNKLFSLYIT